MVQDKLIFTLSKISKAIVWRNTIIPGFEENLTGLKGIHTKVIILAGNLSEQGVQKISTFMIWAHQIIFQTL